MDNPGLYFAIAVLALIVALWLTFLIIGFVFKLIFFALIAVLGLAVYRAWQASRPRPR